MQGGDYLVVYLDIVVFLNFTVDLMLLIGTNHLSGHGTDYKKVVLAALIGSFYSAMCFVKGFQYLGGWLVRCIVLLVIGGIAFGFGIESVRRCSLFLLLSMSLAGIFQLFQNRGTYTLLLSTFLMLILCAKAFGNGAIGNQYVTVEIPYENGSIKLTALRDTGNHLRDVLTGEPVIIVDQVVACKLTGLTKEELQNPINTITKKSSKGMRLIPYCGIGVQDGLLLGKSYANVKVDKHIGKTVVAFAPTGLDGTDGYNALVGG